MNSFRWAALSFIAIASIDCSQPAEPSLDVSQASMASEDGDVSDDPPNAENASADETPTPPTVEPTSTGEFAVSLDTNTPVIDLGEKVSLAVTLAPKEGFVGTVALTVTGLPRGVTVTPMTVDVGPDASKASVTTTLTLSAEVTADVTPKTTSLPIVVTATSGNAVATAPASFRVAPKLTLYVPVNIAALYQAAGGPLRPEWGEAFGPNTQMLRTQPGNGIVITVFNRDSKVHIIHGPGGVFPHGDFRELVQPNAYEILNGAVRKRTMNVGDKAQGYIHGEPNSQNAAFKIVVGASK